MLSFNDVLRRRPTWVSALYHACSECCTGTIDWQEFVAATIHMGKLENEDAVGH